LFHRWNRAQEEQRPLLLTASQREGGWQITLPDLRSRLGAALWLEIGVPDDAMMEDLIAAHCEARGLAVGAEGWRYLATRAERSHLGAERLVAAIDRLSLERKTAPSQSIWREALEEINGPAEPRLF
jgi:chromosomal replication initiation ATPase DnaA